MILGDSEGKHEYRSLKRALLEVIAGGVATTPEEVERYAKCTYLHTCLSKLAECDAEGAIKLTMKFLLDNEFISLHCDKEKKVCLHTVLAVVI